MRFRSNVLTSALVAVLATALAAVAGVPPLVNYQGRLQDSGGDPVSTPVTVVFAIWDDPSTGDSLWSEQQNITPDADGLFSVLLGSVSPIPDSAFAEAETYLSIKIGADPELSPRQRLASVPYAYRAGSGNWTLTGDVLFTAGEWGISRAGNTLYGPNDSTHVNLGVACTTGTAGQNYGYTTVGGGIFNKAGNDGATVGGGGINAASGTSATVGGGEYNSASSNYATVGGGRQNAASGSSGTVAGGEENSASGNYATVGGGFENTASGMYATVGGGRLNLAQGDYSFAAGFRAKALHSGAFVWGDATAADFSSTAANQFLIRAGGGMGINLADPTTDLDVNGQIRIRGGSPAAGKVLTSGADGTATWETPSAGSDNDWTLTGAVLYTAGEWGIARAGNILYGTQDSTHVNLGVACTTGTAGQDYRYSTVGGGHDNTAGGGYTTVGGGIHNTASAHYATVSGGHDNTASGAVATVGGGYGNTASGYYSGVGGGYGNTATGWYAAVGGGNENTASGDEATVPGGMLNVAQGGFSLAAGRRAKALHDGTFVWGDATDADFSSTANNQFLIRAGGGMGINLNDPTTDLDVNGQVRIRGGNPGAGKVLTSSADGTATWETPSAVPDNDWTLTSDGLYTNGQWGIARAGNALYGTYDSTHVNLGVACTTGVAGQNYRYATVSGGEHNTASGTRSTVGGGGHNAASDSATTVGGGYSNTAIGKQATVGGGYSNSTWGTQATVGGGSNNSATFDRSTVGGGGYNAASSFEATVGGGLYNTASGQTATVGGGEHNTASGASATVGGGLYNTASGNEATVPGGDFNTAQGDYSFAAGHSAKALHSGTFVWGDATMADFSSTAANQFRARASGGVWFYTNAALTTGVTVAAGSGAWSSVSDRNVKRNIRPVDGADMLEKLARLEVSRWSFKTQDESIEHIGPMAQDFYELFGVGEDDKHISTIDPDGIALAAIKELYARNLAQQKTIDDLRAELAQMKSMLEQLVDKSDNSDGAGYSQR